MARRDGEFDRAECDRVPLHRGLRIAPWFGAVVAMAVAAVVGLLFVGSTYEHAMLGYEVRFVELVFSGVFVWVPLAFGLVLVAQAVQRRLPSAAGFVQLLVVAMVIAQGAMWIAAWLGMR